MSLSGLPTWPNVRTIFSSGETARNLLILDTGPLLAILNATDRWNARCTAMIRSEPGPRVIPAPVVVELDYFMRKELPVGARNSFYQDVRTGKYQLECLSLQDYHRAFELCRTYAYLGLQLADASVIALSERLQQTRVATTDRRDFRQIVPRHCAALDLLPEGPDQP